MLGCVFGADILSSPLVLSSAIALAFRTVYTLQHSVSSDENQSRYLLLLLLFNLPEYSIMRLNLSVRNTKTHHRETIAIIQCLRCTLNVFYRLELLPNPARVYVCVCAASIYLAAEKSTGLWAKYLNLKLIQF